MHLLFELVEITENIQSFAVTTKSTREYFISQYLNHLAETPLIWHRTV